MIRSALTAFAMSIPVSFSAFSASPEHVSLAEEAFERVPLLGKTNRYLGEQTGADARESTLNTTYRLGSEWGKKPVTLASLDTKSAAFRRAALATAKTGGATSFYLGTFAGAHVMATNHHVMPSGVACGTVCFPLLERQFKCTSLLGTWNSIDLTLFTIEVKKDADRALLEDVAANFDFSSPISKGQELITVGFGGADNPLRQLVGNEDSDCKVFSKTDDFQFMSDPDELNPGEYKAWSFANGCDVSHGDSGSAMVDRSTGRPVGIIWTGRIPKSAKVQSSKFLNELLLTQGEDIWKELSYSVPAEKIKETLDAVVADRSTAARTREILGELLAP